MTLTTGTKLDGYEILGPLGAGGMGEVYRARDSVLKRDVAIKVLPSFFSRDLEPYDEDFELAKRYVSDDLSFVGVMGSRQGADAYFRDMERMRLKYDVKKVFVDGRDVCLFYDLNISGTNVFGCTRYQVEDRRIHSLRVAFDPRPVLEAGIDERWAALRLLRSFIQSVFVTRRNWPALQAANRCAISRGLLDK